MTVIVMNVPVKMSREELAELVSENVPCDEVAQFMKEVDLCYADWNVTESITRAFVEEMCGETADDPSWKENFKNFLLAKVEQLSVK